MDKLIGCIFWLKKICDKVSVDIKKFDSETFYNKIFLKTRIKSHGDEVIDFCDKKILKMNSKYLFSSNQLGFCS